MTTNNGGQAFPRAGSKGSYDYQPEEGMTLRDYFTGQALSGFTSQCHWSPEEYAAQSYELADAMLKAREVA